MKYANGLFAQIDIYYIHSKEHKTKQPGQTIPHKPINRTCEPKAIDTQD